MATEPVAARKAEGWAAQERWTQRIVDDRRAEAEAFVRKAWQAGRHQVPVADSDARRQLQRTQEAWARKAAGAEPARSAMCRSQPCGYDPLRTKGYRRAVRSVEWCPRVHAAVRRTDRLRNLCSPSKSTTTISNLWKVQRGFFLSFSDRIASVPVLWRAVEHSLI